MGSDAHHEFVCHGALGWGGRLTARQGVLREESMADGGSRERSTLGCGARARLAWMLVAVVSALGVGGVAKRAACASKGETFENLLAATNSATDTMEGRNPSPREPGWERTQRLLGYVGEVVDVALVGDPPRVVVADAIGRVTIWNRETGLQDVALPRQKDPVTAVLGAGDGRRIAVATSARLTLWDTATAKPLWGKWVHNADPSTVAMSRSGHYVAARTADNGVTVWRDTSRERARFVAADGGRVTALSLSSNGRVAIAASTRAAEVWDVRGGQSVFRTPKQARAMQSMHLSADGAFLVTGGSDGTVNVWNVDTGDAVGQFRGPRAVTDLKIKNRGKRVLTAIGTGHVALREAKTGHVVRGYVRRGMRMRRIALSNDGQTFAAIGDGYALWQAGTGRGLPAPGSPHLVAGVALNHDGSRVVAELRGGGSWVLDTETGRVIHARAPWSGATLPIGGDGTRSPPGPALIRALSGGGVVEVQRGRITVREAFGSDVYRRFDSAPAVTYPYVLSPNETLLLTGSADGCAHIWEVAAGKRRATLEGHTGRVLAASFDDANRVLATGAMDGLVKLWDPLTGEDVGQIPTRVPGAHAVSVSPDGRYLLVWRREQTDADGVDHVATSQLWSLRTRTEIAAPAPEWIHGAAWSTEPTRLYTLGRLDGRFAVKSWSPEDFSIRGSMGLSGAWMRPNPPRAADETDGATPGLLEGLARRRSIGLDDPWARHARQRARRQREAVSRKLPVTRSDLPEGGEMLPFDRMHGTRRVAVSRDGSTLAAITDDGSVDIWRRTDR